MASSPEVSVTAPSGFQFEKPRSSVVLRGLARARAATHYHSDEEELSDSSEESVEKASLTVGVGSVRAAHARVSVLASKKVSKGQCTIVSKAITFETAEEAMKCLQKMREKQEVSPMTVSTNKKRRRRTIGMMKHSKIRHRFRSQANLPHSKTFNQMPMLTPSLFSASSLNYPNMKLPETSMSTPNFDSYNSEVFSPSVSFRNEVEFCDDVEILPNTQEDTQTDSVGGGWLSAASADEKEEDNAEDSAGETPKVDDSSKRDPTTSKSPPIEAKRRSILKVKSEPDVLPGDPAEEDDLADLNLPFNPPLQPNMCPRNPVGEEVMYFYEDDETWYPMIIKFYETRRDEADARCLELYQGEEWGDEFKLKKKYDATHLFFMNAALAEEEAKHEHIENVFKLIDEKSNGDIMFSDFLVGIKVFEQAEIPLELDEVQLKEIFCEIHGDCDFEDLEEAEDDFNIESSDLLRFCLQEEVDNLTFEHFLIAMWQENLPKRKEIMCKHTGNFYPETQIVFCEDCGHATWTRAARISDQHPDKRYCPRCWQRHLCQNFVNPGDKKVHGKFEVEPHYLEEGTDYEEVYCHQCFSRKFAHDVRIVFPEFPLPFKLRMDSVRPYITEPSQALVLDDVLEGSLIREIDGKRVAHRPSEDVKLILSIIAPPVEVVFRSFVPKFHKIQRLKTFNQIAQIVGWDIDTIDVMKCEVADPEAESDDDDKEEILPERYQKMKPVLQRMQSDLNIGRFKATETGEMRDDDDIFGDTTGRKRGDQSTSEFIHPESLLDDEEDDAVSYKNQKMSLRETPRGKAKSLHFIEAPIVLAQSAPAGAASVQTSMNTRLSSATNKSLSNKPIAQKPQKDEDSDGDWDEPDKRDPTTSTPRDIKRDPSLDTSKRLKAKEMKRDPTLQELDKSMKSGKKKKKKKRKMVPDGKNCIIS